MGTLNVRRRRSALAAGLATMAMALGFAAAPAQAAPPPKVSYVAVGDSYTAGTGSGTAMRPAATSCWRSNPGYVDVVGSTGRVNLVGNGACHGAALSPASPAYDFFTPSVAEQIGGLAGAGLLNGRTGLVSITAGANDVGVYQILQICALSTEAACGAAVATASGALPALGAGLAQTYLAIHSVAPNAKIAVMGYPRLFDPVNGIPVIPVDNQTLVNQATGSLNATIAAAVTAANSLYGANGQYVDVTSRFTGHAANSLDPWLVLDTSNPFADSNFHPNVTGYSQGYVAALMGAVKPAQLAKL
ncbi:SGNH/GDSL hydrolase family protein [Micrococcaceae bacterium Sec5.7]